MIIMVYKKKKTKSMLIDRCLICIRHMVVYVNVNLCQRKSSVDVEETMFVTSNWIERLENERRKEKRREK